MSANLAPGILMLYILTTVLLTVPVSLLLVWRYRRAVQRTMLTASLGKDTELGVADFSFAGRRPVDENIDEVERSQRRRLAGVYVASAGIGALIWTVIYFQSPDMDFRPLRAFVVWY